MVFNIVPAEYSVDDPEVVRGIMQAMADADIPDDRESLRNWLMETDRFDVHVGEVSSRRYIAMTMDTSNKAAAKAYQEFQENVMPIVQEYGDILNRKIMAHPARELLADEFGRLFKHIEVAIELFNKDSIPLITEESAEVQKYQSITGGLSVELDGKKYTPRQASKFLLDPDRSVREQAWRATNDARLAVKEQLDESFDRMFSIRNRIAKSAGCADYIDMTYRSKFRDYGPEECYDFHESVSKIVMPLVREIDERRKKDMGLDSLRPWDVSVDPLGRPALKPFETGAQLAEGVVRMFEGIDERTGKWSRELIDRGSVDLESRMGKAPGGYNISLPESKGSFIFMNAAGLDGDIYTLLHESGHAFHNVCSSSRQPISNYYHAPSEFAEVASMSMELIGMDRLSEFYGNSDDISRSVVTKLEDVISLFPWVAMVDRFQHELYRRTEHDATERRDIWRDVSSMFRNGTDWDGLEEVYDYRWQRQLHIFEEPFYYIEYAIAQLGALQVWKNYRENPKAALDALFAAESLGNSVTVPEMFAAANIRFDFHAETIEPLVNMVYSELRKYWTK